ncbi:hypothetical protein L7F22_037748 [Adiantum nelumboides]|nr:hypothetical protein [Adiantum nelumboides]
MERKIKGAEEKRLEALKFIFELPASLEHLLQTAVTEIRVVLQELLGETGFEPSLNLRPQLTMQLQQKLLQLQTALSGPQDAARVLLRRCPATPLVLCSSKNMQIENTALQSPSVGDAGSLKLSNEGLINSQKPGVTGHNLDKFSTDGFYGSQRFKQQSQPKSTNFISADPNGACNSSLEADRRHSTLPDARVVVPLRDENAKKQTAPKLEGLRQRSRYERNIQAEKDFFKGCPAELRLKNGIPQDTVEKTENILQNWQNDTALPFKEKPSDLSSVHSSSLNMEDSDSEDMSQNLDIPKHPFLRRKSKAMPPQKLDWSKAEQEDLSHTEEKMSTTTEDYASSVSTIKAIGLGEPITHHRRGKKSPLQEFANIPTPPLTSSGSSATPIQKDSAVFEDLPFAELPPKWLQEKYAEFPIDQTPTHDISTLREAAHCFSTDAFSPTTPPNPVKEVNLGSPDKPQHILLAAWLWEHPTLLNQVISFMHSFKDVFAWSYKDLEGIPQELGVHTIPLVEGAKPVRGRAYKLNPKYAEAVKLELEKMQEAGIIVPVEHSEWHTRHAVQSTNQPSSEQENSAAEEGEEEESAHSSHGATDMTSSDASDESYKIPSHMADPDSSSQSDSGLSGRPQVNPKINRKQAKQMLHHSINRPAKSKSQTPFTLNFYLQLPRPSMTYIFSQEQLQKLGLTALATAELPTDMPGDMIHELLSRFPKVRGHNLTPERIGTTNKRSDTIETQLKQFTKSLVQEGQKHEKSTVVQES